MKLLMKYIKENLNENLGRTILIMMSLFIVAVMISIVTSIVLFFSMIKDASSNSFSFEYLITGTTGEYISNKVVEEIEEAFDILGFQDNEYGYILYEEDYQPVSLMGVDIEKAKEFKLIGTEKESNIKLEDNEVIITPKLANRYKLKKGDEFEYYGRNGEKNILIVKYVRNSSAAVTMECEIITNEECFLKVIGEKECHYTVLFGRYKNEKNDINQDILKYENNNGVKFSENMLQGEDINSYIYTAVIIMIFIFAVIFVSLNSIVKIIINERIPEIGTFRSIGATKKQIIWMLILELLIYTIVPSILGGGIGVVLIKGFQGMINSLLEVQGVNGSVNMIDYVLPICLITTIITMIFQFTLSIFELIKVSKMSIKDTIFSKNSSIYKHSSYKVFVGLFFLAIGGITIIKYKYLTYWYCLIGIISILISIALIVPAILEIVIRLMNKIKNPVIKIALNKVRTSSLQINTNIIFVVTVSISLLVYSFFNYTRLTEKSKQDAVKSDMYVEDMQSLYSALYDKTNDFYKIDGINEVVALYDVEFNTNNYDKIKFANNTIEDIHLVYSNDYEKIKQYSNLLELTGKSLNEEEVIVSDYYKDIFDLHEGDTIVLNLETKEENFSFETPLNFKIIGFTDMSKLQNNTIIISTQLGQKLSATLLNGYSNIKYFINLDEENKDNAKEIRKNIIEQIGIYSNGSDGWVFTKDGYVQNVKKSSEAQRNATIFIVLIIVGLSLIGIINNQAVSFMERRRELATLYSIAMSKAQLKNMILIENVISFVSSSIVSIVFYMLLSKLAEYTLQVLMVPIYIKFTISGIFIFLLVLMIILLGIQRSMRKRIKNMNVVEEIKYE